MCDSKARDEEGMGCLEGLRCTSPKAINETEQEQVSLIEEICKPVTECGTKDQINQIQVTWVCSATKLVSSVAAAYSLFHVI